MKSLISHVAYAVACALLLLGTTACEPDFAPRTALTGYRVIGVEASPPEVGPSDRVELTVFDFAPGQAAVRHEWSLCSFSLGASTNYECGSEELEVPLGTEASLVVDLGPDGIDLQEMLDSAGPLPNPDGSIRNLEDGFDIWVRLISVPDCAGCESVSTAKRIRVRANDDDDANQNPVIREVEIVGSASAGKTVVLRADVEEPETYIDPETGLPVVEEYAFTWYSSAGTTSPALTFGDNRETELTLPNEATDVDWILAVRDGRGGLAVWQEKLEVE